MFTREISNSKNMFYIRFIIFVFPGSNVFMNIPMEEGMPMINNLITWVPKGTFLHQLYLIYEIIFESKKSSRTDRKHALTI